MDLQVGEAVRHVDARLLQAATTRCSELVEARLELDEAHGLLAFLGDWMSDPTSTLSSLVRYTAVFMAMTL